MKNNKISTLQLAKLCNVSQGTIDRALNNRPGINPQTKEYILSVAKEYGYRPNTKANPKLIGIIVFDLYNEYFSELVMLLENELRLAGFCSVVMFSDKNKQKELECIEAMYNAGVEGIIICPINRGKEFSEYLKSWNIPIVTVGNKVQGTKYIGLDDFRAMQSLTEFVLSQNYKRIIYYSPIVASDSVNTYAQSRRFDGFKATISNADNIQWSLAESKDDFEKEFSPGCAVITSTDIYALKVLFSDFSKDCYVVGFDNIPSLKRYNIPLISVNSNKKHHAKAVVDFLTSPNDSNDIFIDFEIAKGISKKF